MVLTKQIKDWHKILLDTNVICALFLSEKPGVTDPQTLFIARLIAYLAKNKTSDGQDRIFYISAITISELLTREQNSDKIKRILRVLYSKHVEFIDFHLNAALELNAQLHPHLSKNKLHEKALEIGFSEGELVMAREWITRDYMIIMSGVSKNCDVVLTGDKKTFYPICKDVKRIDCVLTYPELFNESEQYILRYCDDKVDDFLKPKKEAKPAGKPVPAAQPDTTKVQRAEPESPTNKA